MPHIMIIHPEGNISNNPNLTGIVEILCDEGYKVDIYSPRLGHIAQVAPCASAKFILANIVVEQLSNVIAVLPIEVFQSGEAISNYLANNIPHYDLIIGVDRGIIEASIIAKHQRVPYGLISYEILFSEETGKDYLKLDIDASRDATFAVCQDRVRSFHLSRENGIPLERIIDIPVSGRTAKQGERTFVLHEKLGLQPETKIALYIGEVTSKWAGIDELVSGSDQWIDDWALVLHQRYSHYPKEFITSITSKKNKNVYISPFPALPFSQLHQLIHSADIGLSFYLPQFQSNDISARNNLKYVGLASGKTSTYLQHGLPILINEVGEMADYTRNENLGRVVGDIRDIPSVLSTLSGEELTSCQKNSLSFFKKQLDLDLRIKPLLSTIHSLVKDTQFDQSATLHTPKLESTKSPGIVCRKNLQAQEMAENKFKELQNSTAGCKGQQLISKYNTFIVEFPLFALAHNDLGVLYTQSGDNEKALQHYEAAVRNQPGNATFAKNLADFYLVKLGRIQDAIQIYRGVLDSNNNDLETLLALGNISTALQQYETAKIYYTKTLEVEPANVSARQGLKVLSQVSSEPIAIQAQNTISPLDKMVKKIYQKVQMRVEGGQYEKAIAELEKLLTTHPDFALAHNDLGVIYYNKGDKERALNYYEQAVALNPENINFQKNLADFYFVELGRTEDAISIYIKLLSAHPEDIEAPLAIGKICITVEKMEEAKDFFNRVLAKEPNNVDAKRILDQLESVAAHPHSMNFQVIPKNRNEQLPIISIITPSYNQGEFLEECMDSILSQHYPKLEYIVMDGGSTDGSINIIKKYEKYLTYWQSKLDDGQYAAINEGFKRTTGNIMGWLNSDDKFHPGAFWLVTDAFNYDEKIEWIMGRNTWWNADGTLARVWEEPNIWSHEKYLSGNFKPHHIQQESTFWRRTLWNKAGAYIETAYKFAGDADLWFRFFRHARLYSIDAMLGGFRRQPKRKTATCLNEYNQEVEMIITRETNRLSNIPSQRLSAAPYILADQIVSNSKSTINEDNIQLFTYSKKYHFHYFKGNDIELFKKKVDPLYSELKVYQDLLVYTFITENILPGARILEIGGGNSRIIKSLKHQYEFWMVDKLEGLGNGPLDIDMDGFVFVKDYIGKFTNSLPDNYFDFVFSISVLEHVPEKSDVFNNIIRDINRVLKPGALSLNCFDIIIQPNGTVWSNSFLEYIFKNIVTENKFIRFSDMILDPFLYCMSEIAYNNSWLKTTKKSFQEFGKPLSYNVLWHKEENLSALSLLPIASNTLVSAVISIYNSEEFIRGCLQTLIEQTLYEEGKLEIIAIDSGSEQDEKSIIDEYQRKHPKIKYIRTKERETIYQAWNRGAIAASGKYIVNTNTDDRLRKDALEIMADMLQRREDLGVVYIDQIITEYPNENFAIHHEKGFLKRLDFSKEIIVQRNPCGPQVMWRKHLHELVGYFNSTYEVAGDWDFWLRVVFETKFTAYHIPELLGLYYYNKKGLEHGGRKQKERQREIAEIKRKYAPQVPPEPQPSTVSAHKAGSRSFKRILLTTSAAPTQSPFSTTEKRPPVGVGFLIAVLRNAGHEVFFIDNYLKPSDFLETDYLQQNAIDYVGIYSNTICFRDTLRMLYRLEYMRRLGVWRGKIIVGGPHTTVALDTIPAFVDHVVQGEGERAILDIIEGRATERVIRFPAIKELDTLPMPAWDYFVNLPYNWGGDWLGEKPVFTMNTSRGCPFKCAFCSVGSIWGKQYSYFSAERIVSDIEYLIKQYGAKGIYFREDNFTLDRTRLMRFCNMLLEKRIKISWACESRVNTIDKELMELMYRAGARALYFGVESGSQRLLGYLEKHITIEQTKEVFLLCHEFGIKAAASVIVGVPTETEDELLQTVALLEEIKPAVTWYNIFVGIPKSKLYQYTIENNLYEFIDDRGLVYLKGHNDRVKRYYGNQWDANIPFTIESPVISVVMSVFNGEKYIRESIKSILSQTYQNFEFIIINDGSTDRSGSIISEFSDRRIKLIVNHKNIGLTKSLNKGIRKAKGKYIARMDADDISLPHRFESQIGFLENNPDYALVGSSFYQIDEKGEISKLIRVLCKDGEIRKGLWDQNWFGHGSVIVRKNELLNVGGYDERFKMAQDYDLWFKIADQYKIANIDEPLYCWRLTASCISNEKRDEQRFYAGMAVSEARNKRQIWNSNGDEVPLISVIVPTYNRPDMLKVSIQSILDQTYQGFEIIVVNDAGQDVSSVVEAFSSPKISYLSHETNKGLSATRNTGIRNAKGNYIALIDDDDCFYKDHLEAAAKALRSGWKVVYTDAVRAEYAKAGGGYELLRKHVPYSIDFDRSKLFIGNIAPVNCFVFEREAAVQAGLFDESFGVLEDWEFWLRLSARAPFHHIKKQTVQVNWRTDGTTMTSSRQAEFKANRSRIYKRYQSEIASIPNRDAIIQEFDTIWSQDFRGDMNRVPVPPPRSGMVSIVILTFNQLKYTKECVDSIRKHTPEPHEIIFVDNGSIDVTEKWLKKLAKNNSNYRVIANKKNLGFSKGCNQGIEAATGDYVLLLNNDVVVTENWLAGMLECIKSAPDIGIVGPMTNNISGPQQVPFAGYSSINGLAEYALSFRQKNRHRRIACRRIVGFCMLFTRRLIEEVGLLDESFGSGNFEDDDLCLRASLAGYRNVMVGDVFIHHYGSRTFMGNKIDYGSSLIGNRKIFSEKWGGKDVVQRYGSKLLIVDAVNKADEFYRKGDIEKATAALVEAIKQVPDDRNLYFKLAEMLIDGKRYNDALGILEAVPQGDNDTRQLALLGYCEEGLGHNDKAQEYAARALAIDPSMALALNIAGGIASKKGERDNAEGLFKKAIDSDPGFGKSYTNLGSLQWAAGEHTEALNLFERGFILSPTVADVVTAYHSAVAETGSFARAEPVFRDAKALHPADKRIAFFLIAMLIQQEKHDLAMREIEQAMIQFGIDDGILNAALQIRSKTGPIEVRPDSARKSLSICMIVKNEELSLAKCLMSVKPVADEIIVVDTGSTDKTKVIASALGAKVFDFSWTNDFSEARNYSLSKASGGWILVLDADEIISPLDHDKLKKLIKNMAEKRVAYTMVTRNYTNQVGARGWTANEGRYIREEAGRGWTPSPKVRLFVNDKRINFVNPVHELVEPSLEKIGIKIKTCDVPVQHYGRLNHDNVIAKGKEYYRLGIAKIEKAKGDYNAFKELAIQASEIGEYTEAVNVWQKAIELKPNDAVAFMNMGYAFLMMKQYDKVVEYSKKAMDLDPDLREAALNYSAAELIAGDVKKAIATLENILEKNIDYPPAMGRLAAACMIEGLKEEGFRYLDRLTAKGFNCSGMMAEQARAFLVEGRIERAVVLLQASIERGMSNASTHALLEECRQKMKCGTPVSGAMEPSCILPEQEAGMEVTAQVDRLKAEG